MMMGFFQDYEFTSDATVFSGCRYPGKYLARFSLSAPVAYIFVCISST